MAGIGKPTVPDVLPLVNAIYRRHCAGCCLHVVTDDGNCEQGFAVSSLRWAREQGHADCIAAAEMLVLMTPTQRKKVYRSHSSCERLES